jgi:hypothetical protein
MSLTESFYNPMTEKFSKKIIINKLTDEQISSMLKHINVLYRDETTGKLHRRKQCDPHITYLWSPESDGTIIDENTLVKLEDIKTYHTYNYRGFFKPSIYEILAAIPHNLIDKTVAFEMIDYPKNTTDLNEPEQSEAGKQSYHIAKVRLYQCLTASG